MSYQQEVPQLISRQLIQPEKTYTSPPLLAIPEKEINWLHQYEGLKGNIFQYYSIANEVEFLKKTRELPYETKQFYLHENVKRFLGEFVGQVPYTCIPYEVDEKGISFAGTYVMDSYQRAADLGGDREKLETFGFREIESTYIHSLMDGENLPSAAWISPPKIADYGFVFVFVPDSQGHVKEYIIRYSEHMTQLEKSREIFTMLSPTTSIPHNTDDFLAHPLFEKNPYHSSDVLQTVMRQVGIDGWKIQESQQFENALNTTLSSWIQEYCSLIISLTTYAEGSLLYNWGIFEAKKLMLTIYKKAEEIKAHSFFQNSEEPIEIPVYKAPIPVDDLWYRANLLEYQSETSLPITQPGSCPAIEGTQSPFTSKRPYRDNLSILNKLIGSKDFRDDPHLCRCHLAEGPHFHCPDCSHVIEVGKGISSCPACGKGKTC